MKIDESGAKAAANTNQQAAVTGAEALIEACRQAGTEYIFGYPGGA